MPRKRTNTPIAALNLAALSYHQLTALEAKIAALKPAKRAAEQDALRNRLREMAEKHGYALDTLIGRPKANYVVPVKYRNPRKPSETWSGRGRPARWLAALEQAGHKRDEYRVG